MLHCNINVFLFQLVKGLDAIGLESNRLSEIVRKNVQASNDYNDSDGFPRHNANTVNKDSDDDRYNDDDDDDNGRAPSDGAGTVDALDDCGNEHVDKAKTFSLCMNGS